MYKMYESVGSLWLNEKEGCYYTITIPVRYFITHYLLSIRCKRTTSEAGTLYYTSENMSYVANLDLCLSIYFLFYFYLFSVSLWRRANARNVRLYYPYWQYTDLFIFRFVSLLYLRSTLRLLDLCGLATLSVAGARTLPRNPFHKQSVTQGIIQHIYCYLRSVNVIIPSSIDTEHRRK